MDKNKNIEKMTYSKINSRLEKIIKTVKSLSEKKQKTKNRKVLV
tara:strand:- start:303 stop:434 length:132 start_codon:yes stop_codon:yes gene_type:complete